VVDSSAADLVFHNGKILTLVPGAPPAEAIAVKDGLVQAVGSASDLHRLIGTATEVINLQERTVIPGVNDGHIHPMGLGTFRPPFTLSVGKDKVKSIAEIRDVIASAVRAKRPGEWIRGFGWDQGYLAEGRFPSRQDLDDISPDHPVVLTQWSGHAAWVNSKALELAGIGRDTPSPDGGEIVKDGDGEPTGILLETASFAINAAIPPLTADERRQALILAARVMESEGITSITDAGIDLATVDLYADLVATGEFRQRLTIMIMASLVDDLREALLTVRKLETDPRRMNISQVKIWADGVPTQARTAWVSEPYVGGGHGCLILPGSSEEEQLAQYREWVMTAHDLGFQVGTHATGDRAIDTALDAYEQANRELGDKRLRHYVIHGDFSSPTALRRMASSGFGVSFNPSIKRSLSHQLVDVLGRDRTDYQWPYRTALGLGVNVASSSDAPVMHPDFRDGLTAIMTRKSMATGEVFGETERVGMDEALRTYTVAGAWQDRAEEWKGTLAKGMAGDLVVLGDDLVNTPPAEIADIPVDLTIVGGHVAYDSSAVSQNIAG
jgi:hypothetical protein